MFDRRSVTCACKRVPYSIRIAVAIFVSKTYCSPFIPLANLIWIKEYSNYCSKSSILLRYQYGDYLLSIYRYVTLNWCLISTTKSPYTLWMHAIISKNLYQITEKMYACVVYIKVYCFSIDVRIFALRLIFTECKTYQMKHFFC